MGRGRTKLAAGDQSSSASKKREASTAQTRGVSLARHRRQSRVELDTGDREGGLHRPGPYDTPRRSGVKSRTDKKALEIEIVSVLIERRREKGNFREKGKVHYCFLLKRRNPLER